MPYCALNPNFWRLNFENPSTGCRVMWRQHYDIQTDRHTYIHTDRQTEPNYDIEEPSLHAQDYESSSINNLEAT